MESFFVLGFSGSRQDPITGCYPQGNGYRVYVPSLMRFASADHWSPFGAGGINPYIYCGADPINRSDPSGHAPLGVLRFMARVRREVESEPAIKRDLEPELADKPGPYITTGEASYRSRLDNGLSDDATLNTSDEHIGQTSDKYTRQSRKLRFENRVKHYDIRDDGNDDRSSVRKQRDPSPEPEPALSHEQRIAHYLSMAEDGIPQAEVAANRYLKMINTSPHQVYSLPKTTTVVVMREAGRRLETAERLILDSDNVSFQERVAAVRRRFSQVKTVLKPYLASDPDSDSE